MPLAIFASFQTGCESPKGRETGYLQSHLEWCNQSKLHVRNYFLPPESERHGEGQRKQMFLK